MTSYSERDRARSSGFDPPTCATLHGRLKLVDAPVRRPESHVAPRARHVSECQDAQCASIRSAERNPRRL
jgi:hypothetical protein